jgi:methionyl-tRNA formyltransferase
MPDSRTLKVAYFGLPLGALLLHADAHELSLCVLSPIEAPGRRRLLRRGLPRILEANALGAELDARVDRALEATRPDLLVSWFWTRKLPPRWLAAAPLGSIGVHPSLLPRHRGPNPYFWAIDAGDLETGVTVHRLEAEYDTGNLIHQERLRVGSRNAWQLARALDRPSLAALRATVRRFASGERLPGEVQDERAATLAPEPSGELLHADFSESTARVLRRIRALSPVPGLPLSLADVAFFVTRAEMADDYVAALEPGEAQIGRERLLLRTGDGAIAVERATLDDGEELKGAALARYFAERLGSRLTAPFKQEPG